MLIRTKIEEKTKCCVQCIRTIIKSYQLIHSPDDSIDRRSGCRLIAKVNDNTKRYISNIITAVN
jgi:hypothetical protein